MIYVLNVQILQIALILNMKLKYAPVFKSWMLLFNK